VTTGPKLLLDEMLSGQIASQLRARGFDVIAVVEDSTLVSMPDEDLLAHATAESRCLVTANISDFAATTTHWHASGRTHHGLIYITNREFPQDRSFIGAVVNALSHLIETGRTPATATETYMRRAGA
jgi:predicted nuclease of predicted toxin-antitoxin system